MEELGAIACAETELSERVMAPSGRDSQGELKERAALARTWRTARKRFARILRVPLSPPFLSLTALILTSIYLFATNHISNLRVSLLAPPHHSGNADQNGPNTTELGHESSGAGDKRADILSSFRTKYGFRLPLETNPPTARYPN